ncbi:MAG: hypothetical protein H0V51_09180 [Chloroflexi bacterium]|nr:hypothetical protein [Chloroflexota bacterium]
MRDRLAAYIGPEADRLLQLCPRDRGRFLGHNHVEILAELAGLEPDDPTIAGLTVPYVLLATHYFLIDAVVDGHASDANDVLATGPLLFLVSVLLGEEVARLAPTARQALLRKIALRVTANADAVRLETERRRGWEAPNELDYRAAAGRSNSTLLFYDVLCALNGHDADPAVEALLTDLLYHLQTGDDLGDWRDDLRAGNHTMLLRECAARLSSGGEPDPRAIERELLLGGLYELYVGRLIKNLDRIGAEFADLAHVRSGQAQAYIAAARKIALRLLTDVVSTKLAFVAGAAAC